MKYIKVKTEGRAAGSTHDTFINADHIVMIESRGTGKARIYTADPDSHILALESAETILSLISAAEREAMQALIDAAEEEDALAFIAPEEDFQ